MRRGEMTAWARRNLSGVTVTLLRPARTGTDRLGDPVAGEAERVEVANVLVASPTVEEADAARPWGVSASYVLRWPKGAPTDLEGCSVELPAPWSRTLEVLGGLRQIDPALCPLDWCGDVYLGVTEDGQRL